MQPDLMPPILVPLSIAGVCLAMTLRECWKYRLGEASLRWPRVDGRILDARCEIDEDTEAAITIGGDGPYSYTAHVLYEYTVAGRRYRSRRFTWRPTRSNDARKVHALLVGLRAGEKVVVRYDPKRPERAVVVPGSDDGNLLRIAAWGLATLCVIAFAVSVPV